MGITSMPVGQAPETLLQQALQGQVPEIEPYKALAELNKRVKSKQLGVAEQGNAAIQQAMQLRQTPTIAQQLQQQSAAMDQGIGGLPVPEQQFASGGVVAFAEGGSTPYSSQEEQDRARIIAELEGMGQTVGKLAAAGYDVFTMPVRALAGVYNTLARGPRAFGIPLPFVPKEFGTESMTPMFDKYFRDTDSGGITSQRGEGQDLAKVTYPPLSDLKPLPKKEEPLPPTLKQEAKARVSAGSGTRTGSATPAKSSLKAPEFNLKAPTFEGPEKRTAEELAADASKMISPRMSEYDARMKKYLERAQAMQRGEGIDKPSRLKRGIESGLAGATDEVMAARRAGIRPSLGMALAGAGRAASAMDKEYKEKLEAMREKGFEREFALEQARIAQERGETERAQQWMGQAQRIDAEYRQAVNDTRKAQSAVDEKRSDREFREYELNRAEQLKREEMANTLKAASIRADGGGDANWKMYNEITKRFQSNDNYKKAAELRASPLYTMAKPELKAKLDAQIRAFESAAAQDTMRYFSQMPGGEAIARQVLSGTLGGTPGATPGAAAPTGWGKAQQVTP